MTQDVLTKTPAAPASIKTAEARREWRRVCDYLISKSMLHAADVGLVEAYVLALARYRRMELTIQKLPSLLTDDGRVHPIVSAANSASNALSKLSSNLCINPNSRSRFTSAVRQESAKPDPAEKGWNQALQKVK